MKILSSFSHPHVVPNLQGVWFLHAVRFHTRKMTNGCKKVDDAVSHTWSWHGSFEYDHDVIFSFKTFSRYSLKISWSDVINIKSHRFLQHFERSWEPMKLRMTPHFNKICFESRGTQIWNWNMDYTLQKTKKKTAVLLRKYRYLNIPLLEKQNDRRWGKRSKLSDFMLE